MFVIDGDHWTLDLREGAGTVTQGPPIDKADLTLTISDENFAKMVMGKLSPQQVRPFRDGWMESLHVNRDSKGQCLLVPARHVPIALSAPPPAAAAGCCARCQSQQRRQHPWLLLQQSTAGV